MTAATPAYLTAPSFKLPLVQKGKLLLSLQRKARVARAGVGASRRGTRQCMLAASTVRQCADGPHSDLGHLHRRASELLDGGQAVD